MANCPFCAGEVGARDTVCKNCKQQMVGPWSNVETAEERARGRKGARILVLALLAGIGAYLWRQRPDWLPAPLRELSAPSSSTPAATPAPTPPPVALPALELVVWRWWVDKRDVVAEGKVTNVSHEALNNVQAVVKWTAKNGDLVTSLGALVDANPLAPGVTSPFRVRTRSDPAMAIATIDFRELGGRPLRWRQKGAAEAVK
jgi:hypothetical protein